MRYEGSPLSASQLCAGRRAQSARGLVGAVALGTRQKACARTQSGGAEGWDMGGEVRFVEVRSKNGIRERCEQSHRRNRGRVPPTRRSSRPSTRGLPRDGPKPGSLGGLLQQPGLSATSVSATRVSAAGLPRLPGLCSTTAILLSTTTTRPATRAASAPRTTSRPTTFVR